MELCPLFKDCGYKAVNFRIYPGRFIEGRVSKYIKQFYYNIYIFSRKDSMYKFRELIQIADNAGNLKPNFDAAVSVYDSKFEENKYQIGNAVFYPSSSRKSGVVSHECLHMSIFFWRFSMSHEKWSQILENMKYHEVLCYMHGDIVAEYWEYWWKLLGPKEG